MGGERGKGVEGICKRVIVTRDHGVYAAQRRKWRQMEGAG